jgi:serine/threonine-protein kinase RsbW
VDAKTLVVRLRSEPGSEGIALDTAARVARKLGFPAQRIDDLRTALSEAIINAIEHGSALHAKERVQVYFVPGANRLDVYVRDRSPRPLPDDVAMRPPPDIDDIVAGRASARGWGSFLMRTLADQVEFRSTPDGNVVKLVMYLSPPALATEAAGWHSRPAGAS